MLAIPILTVAASAVVGVGVLTWIVRRPQRGILLLAAATPFNGLLALVPLPGPVAAWKEGLVLVTAVAAWTRRRPASTRTSPPLTAPWWPAAAALIVFGTGSALISFGPIGLFAVKVTFFYVALVVILWFAPFDRLDRDHLVSIIMSVAGVATLVGIAQQIVGPAVLVQIGYRFGDQVRTSGGGFFRTFSIFNQPFGFGLYVMMALLVAGAVALADPHRRRNTVFLVTVPFMALTMATSVVRAAILGLVIGLVFLAVIRFRGLGLPLGALAVGGAVAFPFLPSGITSVFFSSSSLGQRGSGWSDILGSIAVHPFGKGLGSSGAAADRISTAAGTATQGVSAQGGTVQTQSANYQPDNYYVKMLLELGPLGLWMFLALVITALLWCLTLSRRLTGDDAALALGVAASIVAAMVASTVATYFEIFPLDVYFWLLLGVVGCAAAQHSSRSARSHSDRGEVGSRPISANS